MSKKPFVIGVAGGSGSGKTFFLKCFLNHFSSEEVSLVSQDDYYHRIGHTMTKEENKLYNFDLPTTIDKELFLQDISKLISGETVYQKEYTFNNYASEPKLLEVAPAPIILVEGLFILHFSEVASLLDMTIFIDTAEHVALERRIRRDLHERGYPEEDVMYKWVNHVLPAYKEFLLPYKSTCHKIITNDTNLAGDMVKVADEISQELREKVLNP